MLLIGWEGLGLASWGLIGHWFRDDDELAYVGVVGRKVAGLNMFWSPSYGGWRAISTIRVGDMPMFFAIAAIYALTGALGEPTLNISEIPWDGMFHKIGYAGTIILFVCLLMGPLTKSAQLPFSEWLMTAMTGPTTVSALLHSATMVAAGTYLFMRLSWYIEPWNLHHSGLETIYVFLLFLGLLSALYGATVANGCLERKVLLAASTMSSLGLMFATSAASFWLGREAIVVAFWYLITHAFAKATLFLVARHLIHATHDRFCSGNFELARQMKIAFVATVFATVSLAGIPPFTAYWVKSGMDEVMHHLHEFGVVPLAMLVLISAIYSAFLAKFLSLNFVKGSKPQVHLHGEKFMPLAYTATASMLIVLLYLLLESEFFEKGLATSSIAVGIAVTTTYLIGLYKPRITALARVGTFLSDRMYMPFLNDFIVPKTGWVIARVVDRGNEAIDWLCHKAIPSVFSSISRNIGAIQTNSLRDYMKIVIGVVMFVLMAASFVMRW